MPKALVTIQTLDARLPRIGDTVAYAFVDGDAMAHGHIDRVHDATQGETALKVRSTKAPDGDAWPSRTPIDYDVKLPERLTATLYQLLRDHVQPGDMEQVLLNVREIEAGTVYSNPHLLALAQSHAAYLLAT